MSEDFGGTGLIYTVLQELFACCEGDVFAGDEVVVEGFRVRVELDLDGKWRRWKEFDCFCCHDGTTGDGWPVENNCFARNI